MKTRIFGEPQRLLEDLIEYFSRAKQNPIVCRLVGMLPLPSRYLRHNLAALTAVENEDTLPSAWRDTHVQRIILSPARFELQGHRRGLYLGTRPSTLRAASQRNVTSGRLKKGI
jgi:hypothetical protein